MAKSPARRHLLALDVESEVLHAGLNLLARLEPTGRRRVLQYWNMRAETLPLVNAKGAVIDEHPEETEPPMIKFIHEQRQQEEQPAEAGA